MFKIVYALMKMSFSNKDVRSSAIKIWSCLSYLIGSDRERHNWDIQWNLIELGLSIRLFILSIYVESEVSGVARGCHYHLRRCNDTQSIASFLQDMHWEEIVWYSGTGGGVKIYKFFIWKEKTGWESPNTSL